MLTHYCKYMTDSEFKELKDFFYSLPNPCLGLCFDFLCIFAMRINDALNLKRSGFNSDFSELNYIEQKTKRFRHIFVPKTMSLKIRDHVERNHLGFDDYLFFPLSRSHNSHLQANTIRFAFSDFRRAHHLDDAYFMTCNGHPLHRITPHTLRHYGIMKFLKTSNFDYLLTQQFSNHAKMEMITHYAKTLEGIEKQAGILERAYS